MDKLSRYNNQLKVAGFTKNHQEMLGKAQVLVVGAGGLGCPLLIQLAALGVGHITIVDHDTIEIHNLNRQTLYNPSQIGSKKAQTAASVLQNFNSAIQFLPVDEMLNSKNIETMAQNADLIVDCTDNLATRYLLDKYCVQEKKPLVFGGVRMLEGQFGVFNHNNGASFTQMFPTENHFEQLEDCDTLGTFGFACQLVAAYQANEVFKIITGLGHVLSGKITTIDLKTNAHFTVGF